MKCPCCNRNSVEEKLIFKPIGKNIIEYSCTKCKYFKRIESDYITWSISYRGCASTHNITASAYSLG